MKKLSCMADFWLFNSLDNKEKTYIQSLFRRPEYKKGDFLFMEDEPTSAVFLITSGRVKLFKTSDEGKEVVLGILSTNNLFGEQILFSEGKHTFAAQALEPTRLCACYKNDFEALVAQNSEISIKIIRTLGEKLNKMTEQLADMAIYETQDRVARTLVRLAEEHGEDTQDGRRLSFQLTHDDLGALVGASRVMVTNVLKSLRKAGVVLDDSSRKFTVSTWFINELAGQIDLEGEPQPSACQCFTGI